jgi:peptidyl-prolyl cis-trans isomerase SurA
VYVTEKRKSMGDMKVAHIMIKYYNPSQIDSTKERIDAVYNKLKDGGDWASIVEEFSEDFNTNSKGGELSWINRTTPNIPVEFKDVAYTLKKDGEISEPIKTRFGWHIVKRIESKPMPTYADSKEIIRRKVERDSRSELNKEVVVARLKKENNFREIAGLQAVQDSFSSDLLQAKYKKQEGNGIVLCKIGERDYTDSYFFGYVATNQTRSNKSLSNAVKDIYEAFIEQINLDYEEGLLEEKYEAFKNIMQEYKDGILLFELTDKKVWTRAVKDTLGLKSFYESNKPKYMWNERADVDVFSCTSAKTKKLAMKLAKKGKSTKEILNRCNAKDPIAVSIESKKLEKSKDSLLDQINMEKGVFKIEEGEQQHKFVRVNEILAPSQKLLDDNRGVITSDYQNYLEESWIKGLKNTYLVQIYDENVARLYNDQ